MSVVVLGPLRHARDRVERRAGDDAKLSHRALLRDPRLRALLLLVAAAAPGAAAGGVPIPAHGAISG